MGKYRHLTPEDREQIAIMRSAGCANGAIASSIGKSPATISRELHRNSLASGRYSANSADGAYMERRQRPARLERDAKLATFVRQRLSEAPSRRLQAIVCRAGISPADIRLVAIGRRTWVWRCGDGNDLLLHLPRRAKVGGIVALPGAAAQEAACASQSACAGLDQGSRVDP